MNASSDCIMGTLSEKTRKSYEGSFRLYIAPRLGKMRNDCESGMPAVRRRNRPMVGMYPGVPPPIPERFQPAEVMTTVRMSAGLHYAFLS